MNDRVRAKHAFGELTLEDLMTAFRKADFVVATRDERSETYDMWDVERTFRVTNSDGETEDEPLDNPEMTLFTMDDRGPTFGTKDKIKVREGKILAKDLHGTEYELELTRRVNLDKFVTHPDRATPEATPGAFRPT